MKEKKITEGIDRLGEFIQIGKTKFRHRTFIEGSIEGHKLKGMLIKENDWYFLQDDIMGAIPTNMKIYPFKGSWQFILDGDGKFTSNVKIFKKIPAFKEIKKEDKLKLELNIKYDGIYQEKIKLLGFNISAYPSCCGSNIWSNFYKYRTFPIIKKTMSKEFRKNLNRYLTVNNLTCILREDVQHKIIDFLLSLGFKEINKFRSIHGHENLVVLSYNKEDAKSK